MKVFDWYIFRNLLIATIFIGVVLTTVVFLTQSLRFLELVMESGASSISFWILTFLALPRFFEIILPLSIMAATTFLYNRMTMDSELVVIRAVGYSPGSLAKPAMILAVLVTIFLLSMTMWFAPKSLSAMQQMRTLVRAQFSNILFREGVFNQVGSGLTVYIRERAGEGELRGLMVHDSRDSSANPSTIMAQKGVIVAADDGHQVLVYDGSRQEYDTKTKALRRLNFERYTIDLPDSGPVQQRWRKPSERTIFELLNPNLNDEKTQERLREFRVEIHRRVTSPFLALVYTMIACAALLVGPVDRRGQGRRIVFSVMSVVVMQGLYLALFNLARQTDWALVLMYLLILIPFGLSAFMLSGASETFRRKFLYQRKAAS